MVYSHIVFFPSYLSHLPESTSLITGSYGLNEEIFWKSIHPLTILSTIVALALNWKIKTRRNYISIALGIYALAIIATIIYFVPALMEFANSANNTTVTASEWVERGQTWQHLSWIRGTFMCAGFLLVLVALTKDNSINSNS
jgi:hypothetical protein